MNRSKYQLSLILIVLCLIFGNPKKAIGQTGCEPEWEQLLVYSYIGSIGMETADYDNDGKTELFMANTEYWCVMEYVPEKNDYEVVWLSKHYFGNSGQIGELRVMKIMDADNDGELELLAGTLEGYLEVYDLKTLTLENTIHIHYQLDPVWVVLKADCDNDGKEELIIGSNYTVFIYNIIDGQYEFQQIIQTEDRGVACGDIDGDGINSLVFTNGTMVTIQNGIVSDPEEYCSSCYGLFVDMLDVDSDGKDEIILANYQLWVIDADIKEVKWQIATQECNVLYLKDVNGDNKDEILYGEGTWGSLKCFDPLTGSLLWDIPNNNGFGKILVTDSDGDGEEEVIMSTNFNKNGYLYIHDLDTRELEWSNHIIYGPVSGIEAEDVDGDGQPEIVTLSKSGVLFIFDAATRKLEWQSNPGELPCIFDDQPIMKIFDVDNDGFKEIIIAAGDYSIPSIIVFNGASKTVESQHTWDQNIAIDLFLSMEIIDTDNDGNIEYVCGNQNYVYILNSADYSIKWRSPEIYRNNESIVADIDNDNNLEIIVAADNLYIFDASTYIKEFEFSPLSFESYISLDAKDLNSDGKKEVIAGTVFGYIFIFNAVTLDTTWINTGAYAGICAIRAGDFVDIPGNEFVFTTPGGHLSFFHSDHTLLQREVDFNIYLGRTLEVTDYDNNGETEIFLGTMVNAVEYSPDCFICAAFDAIPQIISGDITGTQICEGTVQVTLSGGVMPYRYRIGNNTYPLTNGQITGLCTGTHTITFLDDYNCDITVDFLIEGILSITELNSDPDFTVYPVPTSDNLNIHFNTAITSNSNAEIRSLQGDLLISVPLNQTHSSIDISRLSKGLYIMTITYGSKFGVAKVVRN